MTRHGQRNVARYDRVHQLRRLQAAILRCSGNRIGSQQGVDPTFGDDVRLQAERVGLQGNIQRDLTFGADLFELIAPTVQAAKQHERQVVQRREAHRRAGCQRVADGTDEVG